MADRPDTSITSLLHAASCGEADAADALLGRVYDELRQIANRLMVKEQNQVTIQSTALVHEAWLRLSEDGKPVAFDRRAHFFSAAAQSMRRILVEHARRRNAQARGGGRHQETFVDVAAEAGAEDIRVLQLDEALEKLETTAADAAETVQLRYFAGLTIEATAAVTGRSISTIKREWTYARAWLRDFLGPDS